MPKKRVERDGETKHPQATLKLSRSAHHLLVILSSWANTSQKSIIQKMLLEYLDKQPTDHKKVIEEWMAEQHGEDWKENLT